MRGHIKPAAGGTIRAGTQEPAVVFLGVQRFDGTSTVEMDLTLEEARQLGRWLLQLGSNPKPK